MTDYPKILKDHKRLSPYKFYTEFLYDVANHYKERGNTDITFQLFENGDDNVFDSSYRIDPITIPLILSLSEQLSNFHKKPIPLLLSNNNATINILEFLYRCDFFAIAGPNTNPNILRGRNVLNFDKAYLGWFTDRKIRPEHKVRAYSKWDPDVTQIFDEELTEEEQRDQLISFYTYKVREHFQELLFDNQSTFEFHNLYVDVLSELVTNSVMYSQSTAYALMFVDRYKTKFSISDNGVGFEISMSKKEPNQFYKPNTLKNRLIQKITNTRLPEILLNSIFIIFETLFYSSLKNRHGLFDLMINVVLSGKGYFRLHCDNSQIIISNRMVYELEILSQIRQEIYSTHIDYALELIDKETRDSKISELSVQMMELFENLCQKSFEKYNSDIKYSSIRFYPIKFRGVHIEIEIPNAIDNGHFGN